MLAVLHTTENSICIPFLEFDSVACLTGVLVGVTNQIEHDSFLD